MGTKFSAIFDSMDILYRNVPDSIYNLIADKQCQMKKEKKREVSQAEALTALLKEAYLGKSKKENG